MSSLAMSSLAGLLLAVLSLALGACSSPCAVGSRGCACTGGGACDPGLVCGADLRCAPLGCACDSTPACSPGCACDADCGGADLAMSLGDGGGSVDGGGGRDLGTPADLARPPAAACPQGSGRAAPTRVKVRRATSASWRCWRPRPRTWWWSCSTTAATA